MPDVHDLDISDDLHTAPSRPRLPDAASGDKWGEAARQCEAGVAAAIRRMDAVVSFEPPVDVVTPDIAGVVEAAVAKGLRAGGGGETASCADVQRKLRDYKRAGGGYVAQRTLAKLCQCGTTTISKAIGSDSELRKWKDAGKSRRQTPRRDAGDFDIVTDQQADSRPETPLPDEEVDTILAKLKARAPQMAEQIEALEPGQRIEVARLYACGDYDEPSPLEADPPVRTKAVRYHGRV